MRVRRSRERVGAERSNGEQVGDSQLRREGDILGSLIAVHYLLKGLERIPMSLLHSDLPALPFQVVDWRPGCIDLDIAISAAAIYWFARRVCITARFSPLVWNRLRVVSMQHGRRVCPSAHQREMALETLPLVVDLVARI